MPDFQPKDTSSLPPSWCYNPEFHADGIGTPETILEQAVADVTIGRVVDTALTKIANEGYDSPWSFWYVIVVEMPAEHMVVRERNIAALEGRDIDYSVMHIMKMGLTSNFGIDNMTDGLNAFDLTNLRPIDSTSECVAVFSGGLAQYSGSVAAIYGTPQFATQITKAGLSASTRVTPLLPRALQQELQYTAFSICLREGLAGEAFVTGAAESSAMGTFLSGTGRRPVGFTP